MPLTRPFAIDQAYANASDFRKQHAAVFPREGVFPDPVTTASTGIAFANGGWNVAARIFTAVARRGTAPFSQAYGSALISNDSQATAWTIPAAPATGSRIDLLWAKATDPTQGDATTTPSGEPVARAVPIFGVTSGNAATTPTAPGLPSGAVEIARVTTASTATSIANSVFSHTYGFANVLGGPIYFRTVADMKSASSAASEGEVAFVLATGDIYTLTTISAVKRWVATKRAVPGNLYDSGFAGATWTRSGASPAYADVATYSYTATDAEAVEIKHEAMIDPGGANVGGLIRIALNGTPIGAPVRVATPTATRAPFFFSVSARGRLVEGANTITLQAATDTASSVLYGTSPHASVSSL